MPSRLASTVMASTQKSARNLLEFVNYGRDLVTGFDLIDKPAPS